LSNEPTTPLDETLPRERPDPAGLTPGAIIAGRYRIVSLLGRGGMGEVYRADDLRLGQPVALKFVAIRADDRGALERLYHEVRIGRQVSHPNVCRIHDVVEVDDLRFIAMEYVDGEDLASLLRRVGRLPATKATEVAREIASGLAAAHDRGIIHRDLKPGNVMIDGQGRAHITDFGLASLGGDDGVIAGTAAYMAPEQVTGAGVSLRSDVYALGLLLYEMFTGERLYDIGSYADRRKQTFRSARRASSIVQEVDPDIDAVIAACLQQDPELRPASARAVLALLPGGDAIDAALAAGETPSPEMVAAADATGELPWPVATAVLAAIIVALVGLAFQSQRYLFTLMEKPPEVFSERAEEIVARAGEPTAARDHVYFYGHDSALLHGRWGKLPRAQIAALRPGIVQFAYRRAPSRMAPRESVQAANSVFIFQTGRVTMTDPPLDVPGSAMVVLDQHGGLIEYRALPSTRAATTNWRPLLEATGIDMASLAATAPQATPPVASDGRAAWTAAFAGQRDRVRVEAASLNGAPAWLRVDGPWTPQSAPSAESLPANSVGRGIQLILTVVLTVVAVVLARRSLRRGSGDRRGALRLAVAFGSCLVLAWLVAAHHVNRGEDEARMLMSAAGEAVLAINVWMFYIALEPGVRRNWPRSLIGWTRLLAGRFGDAMIGREILAGIAAGIIAYQGYWLSSFIHERLGGTAAYLVHESTLQPASTFLGDRLIGLDVAVLLAIGAMFLLLLFRNLLGRTGGVVLFVALAIIGALSDPLIPVFQLILLVTLLRFGLLAGVAMGWTVSLLSNAPLTADIEAWYWSRALLIVLIVAGGAAWAAWRAISPRAASR
jgi:hypothetical protein